MNAYSSYLRQAAMQVRALAQSGGVASMSPQFLERLALRFESAAAMTEAAVGPEIEGLSHFMVDSWPLCADDLPSFGVVMDAHQRARKRRGKQ